MTNRKDAALAGVLLSIAGGVLGWFVITYAEKIDRAATTQQHLGLLKRVENQEARIDA